MEIISWTISPKGWDQLGIELATSGSAVELVTDCATRPVKLALVKSAFKSPSAHSKVVVSLFIVALILFGRFFLPLFCYAVYPVLSSFAIILLRKRELVALLKLSSCCHHHVAVSVLYLFLTRAVGWSAVCDCGISWPYPLTFCTVMV